MSDFRKDILAEPPDGDPGPLSNLWPLRALAGVWKGARGLDVNPKADGPERPAFIERIELQSIDPQLNSPQLLYGLPATTLFVKLGQVEPYHHPPASGSGSHLPGRFSRPWPILAPRSL